MLTKGDKDSSQPWENPETGARGSVTPLAQAYANEDGRTCRDFLASYVNGRTESWLQGAACQAGHGRWEIHTLKPWQGLIPAPLGRCKNATDTPDEGKVGRFAPSLRTDFP